MSQTLPKPPPVPTRPYLLDYLLLLAGLSLSLFLIDFSPLTIEPSEHLPHPALRSAVAFLPRLLRVPEGVILLFPLFFLPQFVLGRRFEIASGEWLWAFTWMGTVALTGVSLWRETVGLPQVVDPYWPMVRWFWYLAFGAATALTAGILALYGMIRRGPMPWTHGLGLVLAVWPLPPMIGIVALKN